MPRALSPCTTAGCPELTPPGQSRCDEHTAEAEQRRGTAKQRGYGRGHQSFRRAVLARDPFCVLCRREHATVADHWPLSRRELVTQGLNPNDPQHGRGLCESCHNKETARLQPGGWNAR